MSLCHLIVYVYSNQFVSDEKVSHLPLKFTALIHQLDTERHKSQMKQQSAHDKQMHAEGTDTGTKKLSGLFMILTVPVK